VDRWGRHAVRCDVFQSEKEVKNCLEQVIDTFGRLDFAFNNADIEQKLALTTKTTVEEWGPCDQY
jgi:NAD(P)-dependent dehydrogenase (short-subunit alcohol dehydrogenase family)